MKKGLLVSLMLVLLLWTASALGEVVITVTPGKPQVGEVVKVVVKPDTGAVSVVYDLAAGGKQIFSGKEDTHFRAYFRPRTEAEYTLSATVKYADGNQEFVTIDLPVAGVLEPQAGPDVIYSQKDGWWADKPYAKSTMDQSGCALFALSHALQRMGYTGSSVLPDALGVTYANCLSVDGTRNGRLIVQASEDYDFATEEELYEQPADIRDGLKSGDLYTFGIAIGHIALVTGLSEDGTKVRVVDSAPSATFERIRNASLYYTDKEGNMVAAQTLEEMPGFKWFFETGSCGGMEYWLDINYAAKRGLRLIRPPWLFREGADGEKQAVTLEEAGTALCIITVNGEKEEVYSRDLFWETDAEEDQRFAIVSKSGGATLKNSAGKKIAKVPACTILPVRRITKGQVYVMYDGKGGYLDRANVKLYGVMQEDPEKATVTLNGNASGRASIKVRVAGSSSGRVLDSWKTGTPVVIISENKNFYEVEGKGQRVWIQDEYITKQKAEE